MNINQLINRGLKTMTTETNEVKRIVTLSDGSTADFGKRNTVLQSTDIEAGVLTFKVFTGEVITLDLPSIEGIDWASLPEFVKTVFAYGVASKIKTSLAGVKLQEINEETGVTTNTLAEAISSGVADILSGKFSTRNSASEDEAGLDDDVKYFAVAAGIFEKYPFFNPAFAPAVTQTESGLLLFNDEVDSSVISAIVSAWEGLERKEKNKARKDQHYLLVQGHALQHLFAQAKG